MLRYWLTRITDYLERSLLPFWTSRIVDPHFGGFQTNLDRDGNRTHVTEKTLLCQARTLFTLSHAKRCGFDWEGSDALLRQGIDFLQAHFRDTDYGGYYWIAEQDGTPRDQRKVAYGHAFLIYGFAEFALLTGDAAPAETAVRIFDLLCTRFADTRHGGFYEHFTRKFNLEAVRPDSVIHKSLDVHMHLMEAFTTLYELTRTPHHRRALEDVTELIFNRMVDPETGLGIAMFSTDWTPLPNVQLDTLWGSDRFDSKGKPPEITSYGHNIELAWLYLHSLNVLEEPRSAALDRVQPIFEHTANQGVDWKHGGLFVEGWRKGKAIEKTKEFWQQAEALIGFLDAYQLTGQKRYLDAFENVANFVFNHVINWKQGEWFPLLAEDGTVLWDYMGHNWKICYHTVRAMCEVIKRLEKLQAPS